MMRNSNRYGLSSNDTTLLSRPIAIIFWIIPREPDNYGNIARGNW